MNFQLKFIPEAEDSYDAVVGQLNQRWGDRFVAKFEDKVLKCLKIIVVNPYIYPIVEDNTEIRNVFCIRIVRCFTFLSNSCDKWYVRILVFKLE